MNRFTKDLYKSDYGRMLLYSFTDIGDMGDYAGCKALSDVATYNVIQLNVTNLPFNVRFGVCLPRECDQQMMASAGAAISSTLSGVASKLAAALKIDLLIKFNVGVQVSFTQPDAWAETQQNNNAAAAYVVGGVLVAFMGISVVTTAFGEFRRKPSIKDNLPIYGKKDTNVNQILQDEVRVRESTKPFTFKFKDTSSRAPLRLDSFGNPQPAQADDQQLLDNSIFDDRAALQSNQTTKASMLSELAE